MLYHRTVLLLHRQYSVCGPGFWRTGLFGKSKRWCLPMGTHAHMASHQHIPHARRDCATRGQRRCHSVDRSYGTDTCHDTPMGPRSTPDFQLKSTPLRLCTRKLRIGPCRECSPRRPLGSDIHVYVAPVPHLALARILRNQSGRKCYSRMRRLKFTSPPQRWAAWLPLSSDKRSWPPGK